MNRLTAGAWEPGFVTGSTIKEDAMRFLDAAVQLPNDDGCWRTLLFRGDRLLDLNWNHGYQEYRITDYQKQWQNLPEYFRSDLDAACPIPDDNGCWRTLLFKGDQLLELNWDHGPEQYTINHYQKQWKNIPAYFTSHLDTTCRIPNDSGGSWRTLLFKGDQLLELNWDDGSKQYRVQDYTKQWNNIPDFFAGHLDAACQIPNDGGSWRTMLFKQDQMYVFTWDHGVQYEGPVVDYPEPNNTYVWERAYRALTED
ncbi:hypothetical protein [Nocardia sp. NPDC047648]|uniref:hypothetical protein n=1 Tax=Nocardia sp. NPDC047648 TaxID=3155625 RepID=UPI0033DE3F89